MAALAVLGVLLAAVAVKRRAARSRPSEADRMLPVTSSLVLPPPTPSARVRAADPAARVNDGPARMFHLDPARTNRSPFVGPSKPILAWAYDATDPIETAPVVLDDDTAVIGTLGGKVIGIKADGTRAFETHLGDRVYASPLFSGGALYLGSDDGKFVSMSSSGKVRWSLAAEGDVDTAPTVTPYGALVFAAGDTVHAVRPSGSVLWRVRAKRKFYSAPAVGADGTVYIGAQDNRLYALTRSGTVRFKLDLGADVDCAPAVDDGGMVYVGVDGGAVVAVDPSEKKVVWRAKVGGHVRGGLTVTRDHSVVAGVYGPAPRVVSLDGKTGEENWSFGIQGTGAREFGVHGSPVEDREGQLYFGAQDDVVYALTSNGALRWKFATGGDVDAPIVLARDGVLYAASDDGKVYRLEDSGTR